MACEQAADLLQRLLFVISRVAIRLVSNAHEAITSFERDACATLRSLDRLTRPREPMSRSVPTSRSAAPAGATRDAGRSRPDCVDLQSPGANVGAQADAAKRGLREPSSRGWTNDGGQRVLTLNLGTAMALACAIATQLGFLCKHRGANAAEAVQVLRPLRSAKALMRSTWFAAGMAIAVGAWFLHAAALAMAPLSMV